MHDGRSSQHVVVGMMTNNHFVGWDLQTDSQAGVCCTAGKGFKIAITRSRE